MSKRTKLMEDEFYPADTHSSFWKMPKCIVEDKCLSPGAKLLYGVLFGLCSKKGTAWPTKTKLQEYLGGANLKTIYRWQKELEDKRLLRVNQKGRGLPNNYYLLRSPILGNMSEEEFATGPWCVHKNIQTEALTLVEDWLVEATFRDDLYTWLTDAQSGKIRPFPKPCGPIDPKLRAEIENQYEASLQTHLNAKGSTNEPDAMESAPAGYESLHFPAEAADIQEAL